jgi:hypothetical protein
MTTSAKFDQEKPCCQQDRDDTAKTIECIRNILSTCFTKNLAFIKLDFEMQVSFEILIFIIDKYDQNLGFTE